MNGTIAYVMAMPMLIHSHGWPGKIKKRLRFNSEMQTNHSSGKAARDLQGEQTKTKRRAKQACMACIQTFYATYCPKLFLNNTERNCFNDTERNAHLGYNI